MFQSGAAQLAGGTVAATIARNAVVAREGLLAHEVEDTQFVRHLPRLALVDPHQGRMDDKLLIHSEIERYVQGLDERIATVGIAAEVGLADTRHEVVDAPLASIDGGDGDEEEVAPRDECVGQGVGGFLLVHGDGEVGERVGAKATDEADVHRVPFDTGVLGYRARNVHLGDMLLAVDEGKRLNAPEVLDRPEEAGGAILSAAEDHEGGFLVHGVGHGEGFECARRRV